MAQENEIKIVLKKVSVEKFIKTIKAKGFKFSKEVHQTDIYFDTKDWFLYENIAALRLRLVNEKDDTFSFKKVFYTPLRKNKFYVEEIETKYPFINISDFKNIFDKLQLEYNSEKFNSGQELIDFMTKNNFYNDQIMPKVRQVFVMNDNEMVIDSVDKVGTIIELECNNDDPLVIIKTILDDDEWERSVEGTSYMWLKNVKGLTSHISNFKKFKKSPKWNVWGNEKEFYNKISNQN